MFGRTKSANNAANKKNSKKSELDLRLELVEGGGDALMHTPSVAADLATGMAQGDAARAQRLREQLRIIDAELAETKAKLIRFRLMRGPSGKRFVCDDDCIVGGCGEEFAEEDGILCSSGCQLFLCHKCFGATVVMNECQQGGRYDAPIESGAGGGMMSAQGSLPCPNYPQSCSCAHIPIAEIQRALLHTSNRGEDGPFEDLESPGLSPHKVFLMARRRQAETKLSGGAGDGASPRLRESTLVRTVTEARQFSSALEGVVGLSYTTSNFRSGARAALADKVDELEQLRYELEQLPDSATSIPAGQLRRCVQCCGEFTMFEGAQCVAMRHNHFLCNVCFGEYLMKACARGGVFEQALTNSDGMVVSPAGKLPCPFFSGNPRQQLAINPVSSQAAAAAAAEARAAAAAEVTSVENPLATGKLPELDCHCGVVELGSIERVLMDPRNTSASFWRERKANESIETQAASSGVSVNDQAASGPWSWGVELLARGWTPSSVHETARLRVNVEAEQQEEQRRAGLLSPKEPGEVDALADLYLAVANALTHGASIQCPGCGVQAMKDDACIHMDSCPCRTHWCFLCRRISGDEPGQCPRGPDAGGCDGISYYLERHDGWGDFAIAKNGETPGAGAREEFLRRRQAYYVRQVMEATDPELWRLLQSKSPKLLDDVPTPGRRIPWDRDELSSAEFPLFGSNVGQEDISELVSTDTAVDTVAAANFQQHYRDEMDAEQRREQAARRRRRVKTMQALGAAATIALLTAWVNLTDFENPLSFVDPPIAPGLWSLQNDTAAVSADSLSPSVEAHCTRNIAATMAVPCQCGWPCDLMFWVPALELLAGFLLVSLAICLDLHDFRGDAPLILCLLSVAVCVTGWPLFTGPLSHWFVAYILNPVFLSMGASMFAMLSVLCIIDADDDLDDSCVESMLCCAGFVGFFGYVGLTYHARDLYEGAPVSWNLEEEASSDDDDLVELALYQCTAACVALRWTVGAVGVAGCFSLPIVIVADWDENWKPSSTMGVIKIPLFLLLFVVVGFWPLAIEADVWMASVWLYFALCVSQMFTWLASCRALEIMLRGCDWWDAFEDYRLAVPFAFLPLLLECGMLYLFRSSVPDYEGESSSFATLVHVQISFWLFFALFLEVTVFEDDDGPGAWMVFVAICVYACNADAMQRAWFCVLFMFVFSSWTGLLGIVAHELAGEDAAPRWWRRLFGRCAPCLFCVWLIIQNGLMGWTYMRSAPDDMPTVYSIQGASNAQLNGQYHLRVDLLDGVAAETECPHAWYKCAFNAVFGDDDDDEDGEAEADGSDLAAVGDGCLADVAGQYIYQAHSDHSPGSGHVLYRPIDAANHAWIVAPLSIAYASCFKSTSAYLHSVENDCARRPDAMRPNMEFCCAPRSELVDCGQAWREAVLPADADALPSSAAGGQGKAGTATADGDDNAGAVWQDAPALTITPHDEDECEVGDMCCLVGCGSALIPPEVHAPDGACTTEIRSGMHVGVCSRIASCTPDEAVAAVLDRWSAEVTRGKSCISATADGYAAAAAAGQRWVTYGNATAARSACDADRNCLYIEDGGCDGCGEWRTCSCAAGAACSEKDMTETDADDGAGGGGGSCLYRK